MDAGVAVVGLVTLAPLMFVTAVLIRLHLGRPVLFRQLRPGLHGRPFTLQKFRTLKDLRDENGELLPDADRIDRFGTFLRSTSLDELPQLWNVLRGDMSLIGPRPLLMEYLPLYSRDQARRHLVKPGLTGWAQIHGRNGISWADRLALDVWYVDHRSVRVDLQIMWRTIKIVLTRRGISQPGRVTMERFRGTSVSPVRDLELGGPEQNSRGGTRGYTATESGV